MTISVALLMTIAMSTTSEHNPGTASGVSNTDTQIAAPLALSLSALLFIARDDLLE